MEYRERISPFVKNIHNDEQTGHESGIRQMTGMPEGQNAGNISSQAFGRGMYSYYQYPYPGPYYQQPCPGQYFLDSWYLPYYAGSGICTMGSQGMADMAPILGCITGSAPGVSLEVSVVGVNNDREETILYSADKDDSRLPDNVQQEKKAEKCSGKKQRGTNDDCFRFSERMVSFLSEGILRISPSKESYKGETDQVYGFEEAGYLYLRPEDTFAFVEGKMYEEDGQRPVPGRVQLEHFWFRMQVLETGNKEKSSGYRKKITVAGKRQYYWAIKKEKLYQLTAEERRRMERFTADWDQKKIIVL